MSNEEMIEDIKDWLRKRGYANSTIKVDLRWIRCVLEQNIKTDDLYKGESRFRRGSLKRALRQINEFKVYESKTGGIKMDNWLNFQTRKKAKSLNFGEEGNNDLNYFDYKAR